MEHKLSDSDHNILVSVFHDLMGKHPTSGNYVDKFEKLQNLEHARDITGYSDYERAGRRHVEFPFHSYKSRLSFTLMNPCGSVESVDSALRLRGGRRLRDRVSSADPRPAV